MVPLSLLCIGHLYLYVWRDYIYRKSSLQVHFPIVSRHHESYGYIWYSASCDIMVLFLSWTWVIKAPASWVVLSVLATRLNVEPSILAISTTKSMFLGPSSHFSYAKQTVINLILNVLGRHGRVGCTTNLSDSRWVISLDEGECG